MRPADTRVWRKTRRIALKGIDRGRRSTHKVATQEATPGSSWVRRHPGEWSSHLRHPIGGGS